MTDAGGPRHAPRAGAPALLLAAVLSANAASAQEAMAVLSIERGVDGQRQALVTNALAGPVQVRVWDARTPREPVDAVLAPGETRALGNFDGDGPADLRMSVQVGAPQLVPPPQRAAYALPMPPGSAWTLSQGFGGRASHRDPANWHALDFAAAQGTPILAARPGTVMQVVDTFTQGGTDEALKERMNLVRVLHADGSMALYAHIAAGSARVRTGDAVRVGEVLAAVGSVGWSSAPHLHFSVQANDGRELLSLPFRVIGADGRELATTP